MKIEDWRNRGADLRGEIHFSKRSHEFEFRWTMGDIDAALLPNVKHSSDYNEIKESLKEAVKTYSEGSIFIEDRILIGFMSSAMPEVKKESWEDEDDGYDEYHGLSMGFVWAVVGKYKAASDYKCFKLKYGSEYLRYKNTELFQSKNEILLSSFKMHDLPLTDEALTFCKNLDKAMEDVSMKAASFFSDEEKLLTAISDKLLPMYTKTQ